MNKIEFSKKDKLILKTANKIADIFKDSKTPITETIIEVGTAIQQAVEEQKEKDAEIIKSFEKCFVRIAKAHGLTEPLELIVMAENNEENYAEILAKYIERKFRKQSENNRS